MSDAHADLRNEVENLVPYPFWIGTDEERLRFDLAVFIACRVMDAPPDSAAVWGAARVIYSSATQVE